MSGVHKLAIAMCYYVSCEIPIHWLFLRILHLFSVLSIILHLVTGFMIQQVTSSCLKSRRQLAVVYALTDLMCDCPILCVALSDNSHMPSKYKVILKTAYQEINPCQVYRKFIFFEWTVLHDASKSKCVQKQLN